MIALPPLQNIRHEAFCLHYAKTGNATESYKKAGYKAKTENAINVNSSRLLKSTKVQERLQELSAEMNSSKIAEIAEIHEILTAILRDELTEEVVVVEGRGNGFSEASIVKKKATLSDRIKAGTELAKMKGGYDNKLQAAVIVPVFGGDLELED